MSGIDQQLADVLRSTAAETLSDELGRALEDVTRRLSSEQSAGTTGVEALAEAIAGLNASQSSSAVASASSRQASSQGAQTTGSTVANAILDGMGVSPLLRGLFSLFGGGGDEQAAPALPKYLAPASVSVDAGLRGDSASPVAVDYGQGGDVRAVSAAPQVVVNVSAMDTQSFLDRSDDIARAVRRALLESHSLNDVIAEL